MIAFQPGPGHWSRIGSIASVLRERGHEITIATSESFRHRIDDFQTQFVPIGPAWAEDDLKWDISNPESVASGATNIQSSKIASYFFGAAGKVAADLERALSGKRNPDLLISDYTLLAGPPTAERLGIRWATVFGLSVPFPVAGWPPFGSHLPYVQSALMRRRYAAVEREILEENHKLYKPVCILWRKAGISVSNPWQAYARLSSIGVVGSIPECDFPRPNAFPRHIRYVGPLIDFTYSEDKLDPEAEDFVNRGTDFPLVHVTLGLTFSRAESVLRGLVDALSDEQLRLLVSCGHLDPALMQKKTRRRRARLLYRRTVPHRRIMSKSSALICHGGANTLMKALHFGIPTLIVPLGAEQRSNGARFVHANIGRMILPAELTPSLIRDAVHMLLEPAKGFAHRARALAEKARVSGGAEFAASLLEEACQFKRFRSTRNTRGDREKRNRK